MRGLCFIRGVYIWLGIYTCRYITMQLFVMPRICVYIIYVLIHRYVYKNIIYVLIYRYICLQIYQYIYIYIHILYSLQRFLWILSSSPGGDFPISKKMQDAVPLMQALLAEKERWKFSQERWFGRLEFFLLISKKTPTYPWSIPQPSLNPQMKGNPS